MRALHLSHNVMKNCNRHAHDDHTVGVSHGFNMWYFPFSWIWPCAHAESVCAVFQRKNIRHASIFYPKHV